MPAPSSEAEAWAASGAMALTGRRDGPALVAPDGVVRRVIELGRRLHVDGPALLGEHAATLGLARDGATSCGGSARLLPCRDGWVAVNLPRDDDRRSVAAWLELAGVDEADPWLAIEQEVADRSEVDLVERGELLGIPVARVGEVGPPSRLGRLDELALLATRTDGEPIEPAPIEGLQVIDLSSLWAGPLCARLLADRGAQVIKVESTARPDGARYGAASFYDRLHAGTRSVAVDLGTEPGRTALRALVDQADIVIEASRPRALRLLGIDAAGVVARGRCRVWVSITGYGRASNRVGFGDDAAVAGGLVAGDGRGPMFVADAVADPLTGLTAAAGVVAASAAGGRWLLDVSMAGVAADVAGADVDVAGVDGDRWAPWTADARLHPAPPGAPSPTGVAPRLGVDNARVAAELGIALP